MGGVNQRLPFKYCVKQEKSVGEGRKTRPHRKVSPRAALYHFARLTDERSCRLRPQGDPLCLSPSSLRSVRLRRCNSCRVEHRTRYMCRPGLRADHRTYRSGRRRCRHVLRLPPDELRGPSYRHRLNGMLLSAPLKPRFGLPLILTPVKGEYKANYD